MCENNILIPISTHFHNFFPIPSHFIPITRPLDHYLAANSCIIFLVAL